MERLFNKWPIQVSVIIPAFNRATTLLRALHSVLSQSGTSFEILVVDDGSTDGTQLIVQDRARSDPKIRYFYQCNKGPAAARNLGITGARAPLLAFLDSDDEWLPGKLARQIDFFEKNPSYLICQTDEIWIRNGKRVNPMKKHRKVGGFIFERCVSLSMISPSCVMVRHTFFDEVGLFDDSFPACEDYDLWLRASAHFPIGLIEQPYVIRYGGHVDQRSRQFPAMDQYRIQALVKILRSSRLSADQKEIVRHELERKCRIVIGGALKRGKYDVADYYQRIIEESDDLPRPLHPGPERTRGAMDGGKF